MLSARFVRTFQSKYLLEIFRFHSNSCLKTGNMRTRTEIVNPCILSWHFELCFTLICDSLLSIICSLRRSICLFNGDQLFGHRAITKLCRLQIQKQPPGVFHKRTCFEQFCKTRRKTPVSEFLSFSLKRGSNTGVSQWIYEIVKNAFFTKHVCATA